MTKITYLLSFFAGLMILLISGCSLKNLGASAGEGLASKSDTIGSDVVHGALMELTDPKNQLRLRNMVDSLVASMGDTLIGKTTGMRDSLLNQKTLIWADSLVEALTGRKLKLNIEQIQFALVGKTRTDLLEIRKSFDELLNQILSSDTRGKLVSLRNALLGDSTNRAITRITDSFVSHLVDSAMVKLSRRYATDVNPLFKQDVDFITKNAKMLLLTMGSVALAIISLVWWSRRKFLRLTTLLTKHINAIPDQHIYDNVTRNIKNDAMTAGLETQLRDLLEKNGLLGENAWKATVAKMKTG
jgi:hypothetical protein